MIQEGGTSLKNLKLKAARAAERPFSRAIGTTGRRHPADHRHDRGWEVQPHPEPVHCHLQGAGKNTG